MKRIICFIVLLVLFTGCGYNTSVSTINDWHFQENSDTEDYSLLFGFKDERENYTSSDCIVDIRIVNDKKQIVYKKTHKVEKDDFNTFNSLLKQDQYLADIRIDKDQIKEGKSRNGTVYFTVHKKDSFEFDEIKIEDVHCLPVKKTVVKVEKLPKSINVNNFGGGIKSTLEIDKVEYTIDDSYSNSLQFTVYGKKTYDGGGYGMDEFTYKLYDQEGYLQESGHIYINDLTTGDKFKENSYVGSLELGETYTLKFEKYD